MSASTMCFEGIEARVGVRTCLPEPAREDDGAALVDDGLRDGVYVACRVCMYVHSTRPRQGRALQQLVT